MARFPLCEAPLIRLVTFTDAAHLTKAAGHYFVRLTMYFKAPFCPMRSRFINMHCDGCLASADGNCDP